MKKMTLEELRQNQLEILDVIANFCEKHDIQYWLDAGTLLGAVRHKGFIPWDDDIDLGMLRPDYDRFMELFNSENTRYKFLSIENAPEVYWDYGRVLDTQTELYIPNKKGFKLAVNVEIFVLDNAPDDDKIVARIFNKRDFYRKCHASRVKSIMASARGNCLRKFCVHIVRFVTRLFPKNFFAKRLIKNMKSYNSVATKRLGDFSGFHRVVWDKEMILNGFIQAKFEGRMYKIPKEYDKWLKVIYGDYMQLPPVEERVAHNICEAYH